MGGRGLKKFSPLCSGCHQSVAETSLLAFALRVWWLLQFAVNHVVAQKLRGMLSESVFWNASAILEVVVFTESKAHALRVSRLRQGWLTKQVGLAQRMTPMMARPLTQL